MQSAPWTEDQCVPAACLLANHYQAASAVYIVWYHDDPSEEHVQLCYCSSVRLSNRGELLSPTKRQYAKILSKRTDSHSRLGAKASAWNVMRPYSSGVMKLQGPACV